MYICNIYFFLSFPLFIIICSNARFTNVLAYSLFFCWLYDLDVISIMTRHAGLAVVNLV